MLAFLLAMGVGAHALDELQGRPLRTRIPDGALWAAAVVSVLAAVGIGAWMAVQQTPWLWPLVALGPVLVAGYNLELFGGRLHTDLGFAASWGGFPILVGYVAQDPPWDSVALAGVIAVAVAATLLSLAQRALSTPARLLRRHSPDLDATDKARALAPLEAALRAMAWAHPLLAARSARRPRLSALAGEDVVGWGSADRWRGSAVVGVAGRGGGRSRCRRAGVWVCQSGACLA